MPTDATHSGTLLPDQPVAHDHAWRHVGEHQYACDLCPAVWDLDSLPLTSSV